MSRQTGKPPTLLSAAGRSSRIRGRSVSRWGKWVTGGLEESDVGGASGENRVGREEEKDAERKPETEGSSSE